MGANTLTTLTPSHPHASDRANASSEWDRRATETMSSTESVNAQLGTWSAPEARPHAPRSVPRGGPSITPQHRPCVAGITYATQVLLSTSVSPAVHRGWGRGH